MPAPAPAAAGVGRGGPGSGGRPPGARAGRSLLWLPASPGLCAAGLWVGFGFPEPARPGEVTYGELAYRTGLGLILCITGLLGAGKAGSRYRWAVRAFRGPTA
ncbi:hypothetical protein [Streptomyces sp. NPDC002990]